MSSALVTAHDTGEEIRGLLAADQPVIETIADQLSLVQARSVPEEEALEELAANPAVKSSVLDQFYQVMDGDKPAKMNGKLVYVQAAKTVINFRSREFAHKLLCDWLIFNFGRACGFSCAFCYVASFVLKLVHMVLKHANVRHEDVVIRVENGLEILRSQLVTAKGKPKFQDPSDTRMIYSSTLVDIAANKVLMRETAEACKIILGLTHWQIRLLTKSNLLPELVRLIPEKYHERLILGVSTGTLDDHLARSFEIGCAPPSMRLESLYWLQENGFRTFGMLCPSLPQTDYAAFALQMADAIRWQKCNHVWAEVINVRGESLTRTVAALKAGGHHAEAEMLGQVMGDKSAWMEYARATFEAYKTVIPADKLRFLQYPKKEDLEYWKGQVSSGAVLLGELIYPKKKRLKSGKKEPASLPLVDGAAPGTDNAEADLPSDAGSRLAQFEDVIRNGAEGEFEMGEALGAIKIQRLFQVRANTFTAYCENWLRMSLQRAGQLIRAAAIRRIIRATETNVSVPTGYGGFVPINEAQCRPLSRLLKDEQGVLIAWEKAVQDAGKQQPTAKQVEDAARVISPPKPRAEKPKPEPVVDAPEKVGPADKPTTRPVAPELRDKVDAEWLTFRQRFTEGEFLEVIDVLDAKIAAFRALPPHQTEPEAIA